MLGMRRRYLAAALMVAIPFALDVHAATQGQEDDVPAARAGILIREGKIDQALVLLREIAQKDPKAAGLEAQLGRAYYEKHSWGDAIDHLEAAVKQKPGDAESNQLLALSYFMNGKLREAIPILESIQSQLPHPDATGSYLVGVAYLQTHRYGKARIAFANMFSIPPDSASAHLMLAKMMIRHDFNEQALPELMRTIELDSKLPMAHFLLGELYLLRGKPEDGVDEFKKELEVNPMMWLAYWRMGEGYARLEKVDLAEDALKKAIWIDQNFMGPYVMMGKVQLKKGNPDVAVEFLERALKMDPNNQDAHFMLGQAYKAMGRAEEAKREFELTQTLRNREKPKLESLQ
jgi:tetratricopeptide (TPR) repeat protein